MTNDYFLNSINTSIDKTAGYCDSDDDSANPNSTSQIQMLFEDIEHDFSIYGERFSSGDIEYILIKYGEHRIEFKPENLFFFGLTSVQTGLESYDYALGFNTLLDLHSISSNRVWLGVDIKDDGQIIVDVLR